MAFARLRGIIILLAAITVFSVFSTALAAEKSRAGKTPNDLGTRSVDQGKDSITLGVVPGPPVDLTYHVPDTSPYPDTRETVPGLHEASITLADARLSGVVPKDVAARRIAYILRIAKSRTVMERSAEAAYREKRIPDFFWNPPYIFDTVTLTPIPETDRIRFSVRSEGAKQTAFAAEVIVRETITRCQEMDRSPKPLLRAVSAVETHPAREATAPLPSRIRDWFFATANWLRSWIILNCVGVLLGILAGRYLGRRHGTLRVYAVLIGLTILGFSAAVVSRNMVLSRPDIYSGFTTLMCDPRSPTGTADEVMALAKSKAVLDRSARMLGTLNIKTTPEDILAALKTERIRDTDIISIEVTSAVENEAKATADIVAGETIRRYKQIHASDASDHPLQLVDPAKTAPMDVHRVAQMIFIFGIPVAVCFITLLIAYPVSVHMSRKRGTKPTPVV